MRPLATLLLLLLATSTALNACDNDSSNEPSQDIVGHDTTPSPICNPGARRCDLDEVQQCSPDGLRWEYYRDCDDGCVDGRCLAPESCVPACHNKNCGSDGCGGRCGTCPAGHICDAGQCQTSCLPACSGKNCGPDGCGGTCGTCAFNESCAQGLCTADTTCTPNCAGRNCGTDGCGGSCGTCAANQSCHLGLCKDDQSCTPDCQGKNCGSDGCGGSCGTCTTGWRCVNSLCTQENTTCTPQCSGKNCGPDSCGGVCGTCATTQVCNASGLCQSTATGSISGSLHYEFLFPTWNTSGQLVLDQTVVWAATHTYVVAYDAQGNNLGDARIDADGRFAVALTRPARSDDFVVFYAAWAPSGANHLILTILNPARGGDLENVPFELWSWSASVDATGSTGELTASIANGSGALHLLNLTASAMETVASDLLAGQSHHLLSLALLWRTGIPWDCGACYATWPTYDTTGVQWSETTIWLGAGPGSDSAWGYPTVLHEFGHYVAAAYSRDDSPGGAHYIGEPVSPPFAWSEGFASFFATSTFSRWMGEPWSLFWSIQSYSSFWIDHAVGESDLTIQPPYPWGGIYQDLDENWVAHMLWELWDGNDIADPGPVNDGIALGTAVVMDAIQRPRFLYGDRGAWGVDFVDFIDTIHCLYPQLQTTLNTVLQNHLRFPYDASPTCNW